MHAVQYGNYETIALTRSDGILEIRLHSEERSLEWSLVAHNELEHVFLAVSRDTTAEIVIFTGTGEEFSGPDVPPGEGGTRRITAAEFDEIATVGRNLLHNFLDIAVPVIAAVNGPARRHPELPLMANIVLSSPDTLFQDPAHFRGGMVPGDGVHVVFPYLMGATRASYFLMLAKELSAKDAQIMGLVNEIVPKDRLRARSWEIARELLKQPARIRRFTRTLLTRELKRRLNADLDHGFALEIYGHLARGED